jgi:hypothetical protein
METVVLKQRDRNSVEVKSRYIVDRSSGARNSYHLRLYFFFPRPFAVTAESYEPEQFFQQLKPYLRFNTPTFTVRELLDETSEFSPLTRLKGLVEELGTDKFDESRFVHESKLLGAVYKSILRDFLLEARDELASGEAAGYLEKHLSRTVKDFHKVARRFHELLHEAARQPLPEALEQHARMMDEHLSLLLEKYLTSLLRHVDREEQEEGYKRIVKSLLQEEEYREKRGYPSRPSRTETEQQLEEYVYREKMLKKYASEVLFFDVHRRNVAKRTEHLLYALAAGIAMVVATGIAFFGQTRFGSLTTSLFIVLVVGYMLKDRVKDFFRDVLKRKIGRHLSDRKTRIRDPKENKKIAWVEERASYVSESKLPERVRKLRNRGYFERTLYAFEEEQILLYSKESRIDAKRLSALHNRIEGVADINMIDLSPFFRHLSSQYGLIPTIRDKKRVDLRRVKRIYHLNMIIAYDSPKESVARRFRLVVDARGIKRVEPISSGDEFQDQAVRFVGTGAATDEQLMEE